MATGEMARADERRPLWQSRDYLLLWSGQAVSAVGTQMSLLAFPLLVLLLTGSAAQAGFLGAARTLPYLALGLPAGALVDRWNRKRLMLVCDAGRALLLGSIPLALALGRLTLTQLYIVALAEGALNVFFNLASTAALVRVASKQRIHLATAVDEVTNSTAFAIGPALGGALFGLGQALPFLGDSISYALSVLSLRLIRAELNAHRGPAEGWRELRAEIVEGLRWLWRHPLMRFLALLTGGGLLVEAGYMLVVIVLAQRLGASAGAIGVVLAVGGAGSIGGALLAAPLQRRFSFGQLTLGVHWIWALSLPLYALAPNAAALAAITFVAFGVTPIFGVSQFSYRLALIPDGLQGRVNSVFRLALFSGQPAGLALAGVLIEAFGTAAAVLLFAALAAALALAATLYAPMRRAPKLRPTAPAARGG
ncbi:MAG: MFS transporter [Ktedonobacterales bacterium]